MSEELKTFKDLYNEVIAKGICHVCGACIAACPWDVLYVREETLYRYELHELEVTPEIYKNIEELCEHCGFCYYNCPYTFFDPDEAEKRIFGTVTKDVLGYYKKIVVARATDYKIRKNAQRGGTITALLRFLLQKNYVKAAVVAEADENWKPIPRVIVDPDDLYKAQKTKYTPSPQLAGVKDAIKSWAITKLAFVGTPCEVQALRAIRFSPLNVLRISDAVKIIIGTFCFGTYSYKDLFIEYLMKKHGIVPASITKMDLDTHKLKIYVNGELRLDIDRMELHDYLRGSCKICHDFTAKLSDISVGGVGAPEGWNSVIIRSDLGMKIFDEAVKEGYLEVDEITPEGIEEIKKLAKLKFLKGVDE